jgi:hypothetical protein
VRTGLLCDGTGTGLNTANDFLYASRDIHRSLPMFDQLLGMTAVTCSAQDRMTSHSAQDAALCTMHSST